MRRRPTSGRSLWIASLILVDSNVLVASYLPQREHHVASRTLLRREAGRIAVSAHTLSETYAQLTRLTAAGTPRVPPVAAGDAIAAYARASRVVALDAEATLRAIALFCDRGLSGPLLYDFLIGRSAVEHGIARLATWNIRHFRALFPGLDVATPAEIIAA